MYCTLCNRIYGGPDVKESDSICSTCQGKLEELDKVEIKEKSYKDRLEEVYNAALKVNDLRTAFEIATALQDIDS